MFAYFHVELMVLWNDIIVLLRLIFVCGRHSQQARHRSRKLKLFWCDGFWRMSRPMLWMRCHARASQSTKVGCASARWHSLDSSVVQHWMHAVRYYYQGALWGTGIYFFIEEPFEAQGFFFILISCIQWLAPCLCCQFAIQSCIQEATSMDTFFNFGSVALTP